MSNRFSTRKIFLLSQVFVFYNHLWFEKNKSTENERQRNENVDFVLFFFSLLFKSVYIFLTKEKIRQKKEEKKKRPGTSLAWF